MRRLIINAILGVILLFLTNLVLAEDIPINLLTVIICAIGGVIGWLVILLLHLWGWPSKINSGFPRRVLLGSSVNRGNPLPGELLSDAEGLHCPLLGRGAVGLIEPTTQAPGKEHV